MSDDEEILVCAVRYALGRHTYVTMSAESWVRKRWATLSNGCRDVIARDIREHVAKCAIHPVDDSIDARGWAGLAKWIASGAGETPVIRCHHCGALLPLAGRDVAAAYPCCGEPACVRASKRKWAAAARAKNRHQP